MKYTDKIYGLFFLLVGCLTISSGSFEWWSTGTAIYGLQARALGLIIVIMGIRFILAKPEKHDE